MHFNNKRAQKQAQQKHQKLNIKKCLCTNIKSIQFIYYS